MKKTLITTSFQDFLTGTHTDLTQFNSLILDFYSQRLSPLDGQEIVLALFDKVLPEQVQISLWKNFIGSAGAQAFAEFIKSKKVPPNFSLNLWENCIGPLGAKYLAKSLEYAPSYLELELSGNHLTDHGAEYFAAYLPKAPPYLTLDLSSNNITIKGAATLFSALKNAPPGLSLDLNSNLIGDTALEHLAKLIMTRELPYQFSIIMSKCNLTLKGAKSILAALQSGYGPGELEINLSYNPKIGLKTSQAIAKALRINNMKQAAFTALTFLLGTTEKGCPIADLSTELILKIFNHIFPQITERKFINFSDNIFNFFNTMEAAKGRGSDAELDLLEPPKKRQHLQ